MTTHMGHHQKFLAALEAAGIRLNESLTGRLLEALDAILAEAQTAGPLGADGDDVQTLPVPVPALDDAVEGAGETGTLATGGRETGAEITAVEPWGTAGEPPAVPGIDAGPETAATPGDQLFRG
jgi:hypothetical protein